MVNIGLITMHKSDNYGAILQTYALMKYIENTGNHIEVINYIPRRFRNSVQFFYVHPRRCKSVFYKIVIMTASFPIRLLIRARYDAFLKKYIAVGKKKYLSNEQLQHDMPDYDVYLTGSDQVWNTDFEETVEKAYFLDFVPSDKVKAAYASSFGKDELKANEKQEIRALLKQYNALSVREESGIKIMADLGIKDCPQLLDPVFLLDANVWAQIASRRLIKKRYVLVYQLNPNDTLLETAQRIAKEKNCIVLKFGRDVIKPKNVDVNMSFRKPNDFISAVKHADYIVTDSFHGTVFSIQFHKKFVTFMPPKYSGRLISILNKLNLTQRTNAETYDNDINYENVDKILDAEKSIAKDYIYTNIINVNNNVAE